MIEIGDLLNRFDHILLKEENKKELVRQAINKAVGLEIKKEEIEIKNGTIYLVAKPIWKNEIFLKRERIFSEIEKALGGRAPKRIA